MSANDARQKDEIDSLQSIYGDIFTDLTSSSNVWSKKPSPHFQIALQSHENPDCPVVSLVLDIQFTPTYPTLSPIIKILEPKNLLKARIATIEEKIADIAKEYLGEELCFTIIMDVKELLDDFQQTTEQVLSLEEERARRLQAERKTLEQQEKEILMREQLAKRKQNMEASEQIMLMKEDYDDLPNSVDFAEGREVKQSLIPPVSSGQLFTFDNVLYGDVPKTNSKFRFQAVQGFIRSHTEDLLLGIGEQYIVKPYLLPAVQQRFDDRKLDVSYLLTVVELNDWHSKTDIRNLELELEQAMALSADSILRLYGFQIDQHPQNNCLWTVRLLTEFSLAQQTLDSILKTADYVNWGLARLWLIQLLPALEYVHDSGLIHRLVCPLSVVLSDLKADDVQTHKVLKICHPSYGYTLLRMANRGKENFIYRFIPKAWVDPDKTGGAVKSDIWQLGVLFLRIMLSYDVLTTKYQTPEEFIQNFDVNEYLGLEEYAGRVYDLLCKMLQAKASKRLSLLELNAVKFLRTDMNVQTLDRRSAELLESVPQALQRDPIGSSRYQTSALEAARRNLAVSQPSRRRYSNGAPNALLDSPTVRQDSRYERDFEEVGMLGKGGFGEVVKVRNRMEGTFYAVKKIKHRADKLETLLSEVLSLARLNNQYIVRYYGCWVEEEVNSNAIDDTDDDISTDEFASDLNVRSSSFLRSHDSSFQIDYFTNSLDQLLQYDDDDFDDRVVFANSDDDDSEEDESDTDEVDTEEDSKETFEEVSSPRVVQPRTPPHGRSILYIQMEFCENNTLLNLIEKGLPANRNEYWRLFRQILEAVSYIHSSGFIHRDLKPTNIFIDKSNNIKVGDFGLAKNSQFSAAILNRNQVTQSSNKDLSTVVGTFFYTAKEVASGEYDEKIDMYSLGIIFFEMCYGLGTGMERAVILNNLRLEDVVFPPDFVDPRHLTEMKLIRLLLDHNPKSRPGASELLQSGVIPVEHQDEIIKEALRSLADPASPWQQQVRETLFNQPYLLARDLMFDNYGKNSHSNVLDHSACDYLILSQTLGELFRIFCNHGAIHDFGGSSLLPKLLAQAKDQVYELLDRSGSVLTLSYDLVLPIARFLSRNKISITKLFRHEFVYRPNLRGVGVPDKYSAVAFDIFSHDQRSLRVSDAECVKTLDEILSSFPCFRTKNAQTYIYINHSDILNSVIDYAFGKSNSLSLEKRHQLMGILSQLMVERGAEEIKTYLRNDFKIQHTVVKDLVDLFNFTVEPEKAKQKMRKVMVDSPLLGKVERALTEMSDILSIVKKLDVNATLLFCPLSNYNAKYYDGAFMFQAVHRIDKTRKFTRVATGGRYDNLIESLSNEGLTKFRTPHGVGFQLTSTLLFLMMKNSTKRVSSTVSDEKSMIKWKRVRCDVLICSSEAIIRDSGYEILSLLWANDISCDIFVSSSQEDILNKATEDGSNWVVLLKQPHQNRKSKRGQFKPLRVKNLSANRDTDLDYDELLGHLLSEIEERKEVTVDYVAMANSNSGKDTAEESNEDRQRIGEPIFNIDIDQKVTVVLNDAPRGRKNNKREKWELENDSKLAGANMMKELATAPILTVDLTDAVLDMILSTSLLVPQEEWLKKLFFANKQLSKSYASNIFDTLNREAARGTRWAILHAPKTDKTAMVDLQR